MKQQANKKPPEKKKRSPVQQYARYSGMALQLAVLIALGVFLGQKLDAYFKNETPYLTALLAIVFLFIGFYLSLKDLLFPPK